MRSPLNDLSGKSFDVAIIGGGINGGAAAQHLAAEGYSVLMFDKSDFGTGASSRSSRLLHCGLSGLMPKSSPWEFVFQPWKLKAALKSGREQSKSRDEFVTTMPEYVRKFTFCLPIYDDSRFPGWQLDVAFRLLDRKDAKVPLDYRRLSAKDARSTIPLVSKLRSPERLRSVATFSEYNFDWAERIVVDTVLEAERHGATVRNYTALERFERQGDRWRLFLSDGLDAGAGPVSVDARVVMNMTGPWVDDVNRLTGQPRSPRLINGNKGVHIMVRLAPEFRNHGIFSFGPDDIFLYMMPWRDMHYIGPTDMPYEGSLDDVCATEADIEHVLANTARVIPGLQLTRSDVLYSWAGVQPRTFDPANPEGTWSREIHDLSASGMPNFLAVTGATIGRSRMTGRDATAAIRSRLEPSGARKGFSYAAHKRPHDPDSPALFNDDPTVRLSDITYAVEHEHAETLTDIMFRRTGAGWNGSMGREGAQVAARILGECRGWPQERIDEEVERYLDELAHRHGTREGGGPTRP
ncbi:FAD-dependent oxidoreductase [Mesorhizobium sp. LHD-90]|uniref:FAD-dependent oxidoreductase n=1 Tax=Mesorhizobium sp. LHD-90 TaxID=3071414 RepID=UPI0027DFFBA1|nr:FAD-dependent oxidoreductase [Mesorhizobium sp. LHD-90]MDQ6433202.1 FAD-dependent oxidoreductase [Mesorhizobium sp. LHD-90]